MSDHQSAKRSRSDSGCSNDSIDYSQDPQTKRRIAEITAREQRKRKRTKGEATPRKITDMMVNGSTPRFCVSFGETWLKFEELTDGEIAKICGSMKEKRSCWEGFDLVHTPRGRFPSDCQISSCEGSAMCDGELYLLVTAESWVEGKDLKNFSKTLYGLIEDYTGSTDWTGLRAGHDYGRIEQEKTQAIESSSEGAPALPID